MDFNLALIDVAAAWVVVALPRMLQARLLARWGALTYGQESRLRFDPVQQMSLIGTFLAPALTSLAGLPVLAWGKDFDAPPFVRSRGRAYAIVFVTALVYAAEALVFALLTVLLSEIYFAGAPVAARAGQLCLRLAGLSLVGIPILDAGLAWRFVLPNTRHYTWIVCALSAALLGSLWMLGFLAGIDREATLLFFEMTQRLRPAP